MAAPTMTIGIDDIPHPSKWYIEEYDAKPKTIAIGNTETRYEIPLPKMPPLEDMINYGLEEDDCIFRRIHVPVSVITSRDKKVQDYYSDYMWHLRTNGVWIIIKDKPIYINGFAWFFLNFWWCEIGSYADFRMEVIEFFNFAYYCFRDPRCFGSAITKGRRLGDTEKALCMGYDMVTRYKHSRSGMQNMNKDDAKDDFARIVEAHQRMPFFFNPKHDGNKKPKEVLNFTYGVDDDNITPNHLGSRIDFEASILKRYDGKRLRWVRMGEWGKIDSFDINEQWQVLKLCVSLYNGTKIVGMALHESTVEDLGEGKNSLERAKQFWDEANPNDRLSNGQTQNGLYHFFRDARLSAPTDKWGFHKKEEAVKAIEEQAEKLTKQKKYRSLGNFRRKMPLYLSDVFLPPNASCSLIPEILDMRKSQLDFNKDDYGNEILQGQRYSLHWSKGVGSPVIARPSIAGRFLISQMPKLANAQKTTKLGVAPVLGDEFILGVDPTDHDNVSTGSSIGAAIYRGLNLNDEVSSVKIDPMIQDFPDEVKHLMVTDQFCASYLHNPDFPSESFEDLIKLAVFFSAKINAESNKVAFIGYVKRMGLEAYLWFDKTKVVAGQPIKYGTYATERIVDDYVSALQGHIEHRWQTIRLMELLIDWRKFTKKTRTKRDLSVGSGMAILPFFKRDIIQHKKREKAFTQLWETHN